MDDGILKWFKRRWGILHVEESVETGRRLRVKGRYNMRRAKKAALVNGEQQYFLKICDSSDPVEVDCPLPLPESENHD